MMQKEQEEKKNPTKSEKHNPKRIPTIQYKADIIIIPRQ